MSLGKEGIANSCPRFVAEYSAEERCGIEASETRERVLRQDSRDTKETG